MESEGVRTRGLSMFPALIPGDEVQVVSATGLSSGDIVVFLDVRGHPMAHRLLGYCAATNQLLTRGDSNADSDHPTPSHSIVGQAARVRRRVLGLSFDVPRICWQRKWLPVVVSRTLARICVGCYPALGTLLRPGAKRNGGGSFDLPIGAGDRPWHR